MNSKALAKEKNYIAQSKNRNTHADFPLVVPSLLYTCVMLCQWAVRTIAHRLDTALAQMIEMSALCWTDRRTTVGWLLGTTPMYIQASRAVEPTATVGALRGTMLFMHWLQSLSSALVPCSVTLPMEAPLTLQALHLAM